MTLTFILTILVPRNFEDLLSQYTHKGYRVIACAARYEQKLSWMKVQKMTRGDAESDLEFVGFIIFENKLKQATTETITELNQAGIRNVMCTGDNILTAVSVARECGMVSKSEQCFIPHIVEGKLVLRALLILANSKQIVPMVWHLHFAGRM